MEKNEEENELPLPSIPAGNPHCTGRLSTVDLAIKVACFVKDKKYFSVLKTAGLKLLVQGRQLN
jgi:hypothetical protein